MEKTYEALTQAMLEDLARELSLWARPGLAIRLSGDVGAGKSTFARAFIKALAHGADIDVPSPTFTLLQTYDATRVPVAHIDLYRLRHDSEIEELGIDELLRTYAVLVEWPEKWHGAESGDQLAVTLSGAGTTREMRLEAHGHWAKLLARNDGVRGFLAGGAFAAARRSFFEGDASSRRYEMLATDTSSALLMDMPRRPDGPPVKDGKPYSAIAHLAEGIDAVIAVNQHLAAQGYSAPRLYDADRGQGFAIIEYLGEEVYGRKLRRGDDMTKPMMAAVELLADISGRIWPSDVPIEGGARYAIPPYDRDALLIEADLLASWYWPHVNGAPPPAEPRAEFAALWQEALRAIPVVQPVWTLRDFHSPNLLWLPERQGVARVGLIDTQDCVIGHPAYDLASLIQDARVDVPVDLAHRLLAHYCELRRGQQEFDQAEFLKAYAILGAQRATKILGIFARLNRRDGKPQYLAHLPRMLRHLSLNLAHPALNRLKHWYERHLGLSDG
jgi:N-acetylmuramate 1-kinase